MIYEDPSDLRVAEFIGSPKINVLPVELRDGKLSLFGRFLGAVKDSPQSGVFQLGLRPEAVRLAGSDHVLAGKVVHVENLGSEIYAQVSLQDQGAQITLKTASAQRAQMRLGAHVRIGFDLKDGLLFDANGTRQRRIEVAVAEPVEAA